MQAQESQQVSHVSHSEPKKKKKQEGFVQETREYRMYLYGPNSPRKDYDRIFELIRYRSENNRKEWVSMSRDFILENTGVEPKHFARNVKKLESDDLIEVKRGNYRDSCAQYRLKTPPHISAIVPKKPVEKAPNSSVDNSKPPVDISAVNVDNSNSSVDNSKYDVDKKNRNTKLVSEEESKHQIGVTQHQTGGEPVVSTSESQADSPSTVPCITVPELRLTVPEEKKKSGDEILNLKTLGPETGNREQLARGDWKTQLLWLKETGGGSIADYEKWLVKRQEQERAS